MSLHLIRDDDDVIIIFVPVHVNKVNRPLKNSVDDDTKGTIEDDKPPQHKEGTTTTRLLPVILR